MGAVVVLQPLVSQRQQHQAIRRQGGENQSISPWHATFDSSQAEDGQVQVAI
jgi:hypothetical protein